MVDTTQRFYFARWGFSHNGKKVRAWIQDFGYIIKPLGSSFVLVNVYQDHSEDDTPGCLEIRKIKDFLPCEEDNGGYEVRLFHDVEEMVETLKKVRDKDGFFIKMSQSEDGRLLASWCEDGR